MVRSKWKTPYVHYSLLNYVLKNKHRLVIRTKSRASTILYAFIGLTFEVYTGKQYTKVFIDEKMVGRKLGEFSFTRKIGKIHEKRKKKIKK